MLLIRRTVLVAAAGVWFTAPAAYSQTADLSYKWREGSRLVYELNNQVLQESETPFGNTGSEVEVRSVQSLSVERVRRGDGTIRATTESVRLTGDLGPGGSISFDSENPRDRRRASDPNIAPFVFLLGKSYTMTLTPAGEVVRLDGYAQHLNELLASQRDPAVAQALQLSMSESIFRANLEQMWRVVPGEEVDVGESWSVRSTQTIPGFGEVIVNLQYTFEGIESMEGMDVAIITSEGTATMGAGGMPGVRIRITESSIQGTIAFGIDLGVILEMEMDQGMVIEVRAQGQTVTQTIETLTVMELIDIEGIDLGDAEVSDRPASDRSTPSPRPAPAPAPPPGAGAPGGKP